MSGSVPFVSVCIPTYDRLDILRRTLESIYANIDGVDLSDFEVVVSDNQPNQSARRVVSEFCYKNIKYCPTTCKGFSNSVNALINGSGQLLKLHNNYVRFKKGALKSLIDDARLFSNDKPVVFFSGGVIFSGKKNEYFSFSDFMERLSYHSSWSAGFCIWKDDFLRISQCEYNEFFPQTSMLLLMANKKKYIINDMPIFDDQSIPGKGGYNIFRVFAVEFVALIKDAFLRGDLSERVFLKIKRELLLYYLPTRFFKTVIARIDRFEKDGVKQSVTVNYSIVEYYFFVFLAFFSPFYFLYRKTRLVLVNVINRW